MALPKKLVAVAIIIVAAIVIAGAAYYLTLPPPPAPIHKIPIGVLVDVSGPLTTFGINIRDSTLIAAEDVNKYFEEKHLPYKVEIYTEDTRVDPKIALDKTELLHGKGIKLIVGPMGSGEVANILPYVTGNKIVVISPSSTAIPKLIGVTKPEEKKFIFRFVPTDAFQARAIAGEAKALGIKAVVITYIGNAWGKGLRELGIPEFKKLDIKVKIDVEYPDPPPADFSPYIATLEKAVEDLLKEGYTSKQIAVVAFSYEEVATLIAQIPEGSLLLNIPWIGCDGTALSEKVVKEVPERASKVGLYSTLFKSKGPGYEEFDKKFKEKFGLSPYQYGLNAYDAVWVMALSYVEVHKELGKYDPDVMVKKVIEVTKRYTAGEFGVFPISGPISLDEFNDRASGNYAIYAVIEGKWKEVGEWNYKTGEVTWFK